MGDFAAQGAERSCNLVQRTRGAARRGPAGERFIGAIEGVERLVVTRRGVQELGPPQQPALGLRRAGGQSVEVGERGRQVGCRDVDLEELLQERGQRTEPLDALFEESPGSRGVAGPDPGRGALEIVLGPWLLGEIEVAPPGGVCFREAAAGGGDARRSLPAARLRRLAHDEELRGSGGLLGVPGGEQDLGADQMGERQAGIEGERGVDVPQRLVEMLFVGVERGAGQAQAGVTGRGGDLLVENLQAGVERRVRAGWSGRNQGDERQDERDENARNACAWNRASTVPGWSHSEISEHLRELSRIAAADAVMRAVSWNSAAPFRV